MPYRSKKQWRYFFSQLPEHAKEWADKTDFSKLPEKVKKKKKKDKSDCGERALQLANKYERTVKVLPDGSGFFVGTLPLPKDHWLYLEEGNELPITIKDPLKKQKEAAKYAIRAATNKGKITDFDPDAMVQEFILAMR